MNSTQIFDSGYFQWLIDPIPDSDRYSMLLFTLLSKDYYYSPDIPIDGCRGNDGLDLRRHYIEHTGLSGVHKLYFYERPCSVLEWLLAMARRCEDQVMFNAYEGDRTMLWFWSMIDNMGLSKYDDSVWTFQIRAMISAKLDDILARRFPEDGAGSPFPLKETNVNIQKCDWWKALNLWLNENFSDEFDCDLE